MLIAQFKPRAGAIVALIPYWLLYNRFPLFGDSGDNVIRLILLYSLLLTSDERLNGAACIWLHNIGLLLATGQTCIIYFTSGLLKAGGSAWIDGTAVYLASQNELLFGDNARSFFALPAISAMATYSTLIFELAYPMALMSRFRKTWISIAITFHVFTILGMGLVSFGLAMIALNSLFISNREYEFIFASKSRLTQFRLKFAARARAAGQE